MKLMCERNILLENISLVQKAVSGKSSLDILECILLKCDDDGFRMMATDLDIGIKTDFIECEIIEKGAIALPARFFGDIIRKMPEGMVSVEIKSSLVVIIKCKQSEFKIVGKNPEEFPDLPEVERNNKYVIKQSVCKKLIKHTIFSIGFDETKPVLMGALLEINNDGINMVTCDAMRVSYIKEEYMPTDNFNPVKVIIPSKAISELLKLLDDEDVEMSFYITNKHILFDLSKCILVSRLIEGEFINYKSVFPEDFETKVIINKDEFADAIDRAVLISLSDNKKPVRLVIKDNCLNILTGAETGNSFDEIEIEFFGDDIEITFNPKYLLDAVQAVETDKLHIDFNTQFSPCVIRPLEIDSYKYLILPLRIR